MKRNNDEILSPVTFVNDKIETNSSLNYMFLMPYEMKMASDLLSSKAIDYAKSEMDTKSNEFASASYNIYTMDKRATDDTIIAYIVSNLSDLVNNILIKISYKIASSLYKTNGIKINVELDTGICRDIIVSNINNLSLDWNNEDMGFAYVNIFMDQLFSHFVSDIFDKFIKSICISNIDNKDFYDAVYMLCYELDEPPKNDPTPENAYTFTSSILREFIMEDVTSLRAAMFNVTETIVMMCTNRSKFAENVSNPKYSTQNTINENKLLNDALRSKFLEDINNETDA